MIEDQYEAFAVVDTDAPERYAKQLASHLGRRSEVLQDGPMTTIVLTVGSCELLAGDDALELHATAGTPEDLETVTRVVGSHLERFGQRSELRVRWDRPTA